MYCVEIYSVEMYQVATYSVEDSYFTVRYSAAELFHFGEFTLYFTHMTVNENTELRLLELNHAQQLFDLVHQNRQHLRQWLPWLDVNTGVRDSFDFIQSTQKQFADKQSLVMGIWHKGDLVGVIGHNRIDWSSRIAYPGYWLSSSAMGQGTMTACCKTLINHAFSELGLNRIDIRCAIGNHKSCAIPKRLGFTHEGVIRQAEWLYDRFVDHNIFSLLACDWKHD